MARQVTSQEPPATLPSPMPLRHDLELLAPARDADIGIAAIAHGADAVYIGGPSWGARVNAGNELADIERLCTQAHRYGSRIFVTLNTILRDDELEGARRLAWQLYEAGADALIVQDMGLLEVDLPPIQLHASTQTDIRTPQKARFLQDAGFSQMVLARELSAKQIRAITEQVQGAVLEFFIHGALCVAYSGQCFISHAHTGRSANRGNCSQECRLPYIVTDAQGRVIAHDKHVLSLKDNNQSDNLRALMDAGIRSFKIEGRYKDLGYVKNVTAHYRQLFDALLAGDKTFRPASSGRTTFLFTPDPQRNFNRGATDYFVNERKIDIGSFDTPKHAGMPLGYVIKRTAECFEVALEEGVSAMANGDGLSYFDLQQELVGVQVNVAQPLDGHNPVWRVFPNEPMANFKDLRVGTALQRNRDMQWDRALERKSSDRRIGVRLALVDSAEGFALSAIDEDGHVGQARAAHAHQPAHKAEAAQAALHEHLGKLGNTIFVATQIDIHSTCFVPASLANSLRRQALEDLQATRAAAWQRLPRALPLAPPVPFPDDTLSYLANVFNHKARDFYARHGVKVIAAAYESHQELGEASLMITKHCVRWSLSLCPKQAKGVTGVQGTIRAEPLTMVHGDETLTLRFDCKPCEMHVVGRIKHNILQQAAAQPLTFYRQRPLAAASA